MRYAEVSVNSPAAQRRTFSYSVPDGLDIEVGQAVWVPFGDKILQGIVLELSPYPAVEETREIIDVIEPQLVLSRYHIALARWISEYYLADPFDAIAMMLPPGFKRNALTFIATTPKADEVTDLTPPKSQLLEFVQKHGKMALRELEKALGKKKAQNIVAQMVKQGILSRSYELEPIKIKAKTEPYLHLLTGVPEATQEAYRLRRQRAARQADLLEFLCQSPEPVSLAALRKSAGYSPTSLKALADKGFIRIEYVEVKREPISYRDITPSGPLSLTTAQKSAFEAIKASLSKASEGDSQPDVFLLHGVTGSGKTEIYLQALAAAVRMGRRGIVLVPEIALTPQTIERFASRFPKRVAVLHSALSPGEQFDEWHLIRSGNSDVVIGSRSAIFAPQPQLGLIIIDEEHEWTYKQQDKAPRYHARDVAIKLAEVTGAVVLLGSATPDVVTFYHSRRRDYRLLQLPERVVPSEGSPLPQVEVVDMKAELKAGNRSIFSRPLAQAVEKAVTAGEQVILFLNRRGSATFIQCRNCGLTLRCRRCEIPLTYHTAENVLTCHQCNYKSPLPQTCPRCLSRQLKFLGIGTQKLEQEASYAFPSSRRLRWDSDITTQKGSHERILNKFRAHEADILIGTQMIAKGLHLPLVTLVGVVSADTSLNLPDFRAGERTFQLLSQVAGRAGRGPLGGLVIIQTFSQEHYAIQAAARHDYASFYEREIDYRRQLNNPPFKQLALLVYSHTNDVLCQREAERIRNLLGTERDTRGITDVNFIGPAPAFMHRLRGKFRWQLVLRGSELSTFLSPVPFPQGWAIDIDPASML